MKGLFISGSGTDVGKTFIAQRLVRLLAKSKSVSVRKPVESDCHIVNGELVTKDALKLLKASNVDDHIDTVCPFKFYHCSSAESASKAENTPLSLDHLIDACSSETFVVIEGAGGLLSPLAENTLNIDLAKSLNLPLVIVVKDELGAVNQALLTIKVARQYQLEIGCLILNQIEANTLDNANAIRHYGDCEVVLYNGVMNDKFEQQLEKILDLV
ncbi:dethiobiotin synthase [Candidatus Thioglobus sp.]|uniref:dethiobiotin synthase n=1 Tax=Candidatus Thioglobus sp. TaxID=2026721 RepID=UPI001D97E1A5|nr:dethiobiotin synthase [Candidatus Thioglobus sp.]MBT3276447.1 dethiobiotin synthase [Candidatus Thioglobus sp.]MBT3446717.1 dethiobiotin synthase [Candidatus Thioglobus sp.]MBT3745296.1 dethiobiotin synthase [Candidatus Thioglobus sp.]MBT4001012.1 dethiobiotin synthase [Candidatus Thioglobus sp.]MBT4181622.1 dethiobiotin synthase [Candidatus Thioglobus sp.]